MRKILKRLSRFFVLLLRMLTEDFRPAEENAENGGKKKTSAEPKRNHTYNNEKAFRQELIAVSLMTSGRKPFGEYGAGKDAGADKPVIPEYVPDGGT